MKTKEELNALKEEVETLNKKLAELTEDELEQVTGGDLLPRMLSDMLHPMTPLLTNRLNVCLEYRQLSNNERENTR